MLLTITIANSAVQLETTITLMELKVKTTQLDVATTTNTTLTAVENHTTTRRKLFSIKKLANASQLNSHHAHVKDVVTSTVVTN